MPARSLQPPLTITVRAILLPYPGARWFVALLGPIPHDPPVVATTTIEG